MMQYVNLVGMNAQQVREIFLKENVTLLFEDIPGMYLMWTEDERIGMDAYAIDGLVRGLTIDLSATSERPADLPYGLQPEFTLNQVRQLLGEPTESKGVQIAPILGERAAFDRFNVQGRVVDVAYKGDGRGIYRIGIRLTL